MHCAVRLSLPAVHCALPLCSWRTAGPPAPHCAGAQRSAHCTADGVRRQCATAHRTASALHCALPAHCRFAKAHCTFWGAQCALRFSAVRFEICALRSALRSARAHCARTAECTARASGAHCASPPPGRLASLMTSPSSLMTSRVGVDRARTDTATPTPPPSSLFARAGCLRLLLPPTLPPAGRSWRSRTRAPSSECASLPSPRAPRATPTLAFGQCGPAARGVPISLAARFPAFARPLSASLTSIRSTSRRALRAAAAARTEPSRARPSWMASARVPPPAGRRRARARAESASLGMTDLGCLPTVAGPRAAVACPPAHRKYLLHPPGARGGLPPLFVATRRPLEVCGQRSNPSPPLVRLPRSAQPSSLSLLSTRTGARPPPSAPARRRSTLPQPLGRCYAIAITAGGRAAAPRGSRSTATRRVPIACRAHGLPWPSARLPAPRLPRRPPREQGMPWACWDERPGGCGRHGGRWSSGAARLDPRARYLKT